MKLDWRLLRETRAVQPCLALAVGAGWLGGVATVLQALYLSRVIAEVFMEGRSLADVRGLLVMLLAAIVARAGLTWARETAARRAADRAKAVLRERLFAQLLALGPARVRDERTGELASTAVEGVEALDGYFNQYLPSLALAALVPLTILAFVFPADPLSGLVLLLTAPLIPLFMVLIGRLADLLARRQWESLGRMSAHFLDVLQGLTTLKLFGRSEEQVETIARISDRFRMATMAVLRIAFLSALALELLASIGTAIVAVEVGLRLLHSMISFEQAFFVLILAPELYLPLRTLGASFHASVSGAAAARRIFEVLDAPLGQSRTTGVPVQRPSGQHATSSGPDSAPPRGGVEVRLENVHYAYDGGRRQALKGVSFRIGRGEKVALVGPSGSGKSTVAHLLLRFIEPDRGRIFVDGTPLDDLPPQIWRQWVAWVPQSPYLFHTPIAENIRLARPEASLEEVIGAARLAGAHEFIMALPQGYDTVVGEQGARLSGGQAQRIALARAFLKNAPFLILDEATANLDAESAAEVQRSLDRLLEGRSALIIAHRLESVRQTDRVVVMANGRAVEAGAHEALLRREGLFQRLVVAQRCGRSLPACGEQPADRAGLHRHHSSLAQVAARSSGAEEVVDPMDFERKQCESELVSAPAPGTGALTAGPTLLRLLRLAAPLSGRLALSVLLGFATVASGVGLMATAAYVIAGAALHPSVADLAVPIVGVRFFGISRGVFRYLERCVSHDATFRLLAQLRVWLYRALEPLAPARLIRHRTGDLLTRAVSDVETLQHFYIRAIAPPAVALLVASFMWVFLHLLEPRAAATLLAFLLLGGLGVPLIVGQLSSRVGREMAWTRSALNTQLVDGIQGMAELVAYGQDRRQLDALRKSGVRWLQQQERMSWISGLHAVLGSLLPNLAAWSVLVVAIPAVADARLSGPYLPVLVLASLASFEAVIQLPLAFQQLGSSLEAGRRLFEIVDTPAPLPDPPAPHPKPSGYGLVVDALSFRYGPGEPLALDGVSFELREGCHLAVVGPSGAGKSTLAHLLVRLWDYDEGRIFLGGHDLRSYPPEQLRRMIAVVPQRIHLFNGTIRENLLLARPNASEEEMIQAARLAQLDSFVQSLPRGYESLIGEQGLRLSGGERQRIAIARALLRDAPILLLDEPTANLDSLTEREVMKAIEALTVGRTTLLVTHRLVGLESADEILVMSGGRVVERGDHRELLLRGGLYRRMWEAWCGGGFGPQPPWGVMGSAHAAYDPLGMR